MFQSWQERDTRDDAMFESARITDPTNVERVVDDFLKSVDNSGPTIEDLEATYRV
jgi:hypothetical protein